MAIIYHKKVFDHKQWEGHPESPFRIRTLKKKLVQEGLWKNIIPPKMIRDKDVLKVHTEDHLRRLKYGGGVLTDPDTMVRNETYELAMLSASIATTAVKLALKGVPSFAVCRPPGHHAGRGSMEGFCYLNNVAIAVEAAGVRTAIVDIDAHHGNGTEEIFYGRSDVLLIDVHESCLFTETGNVDDMGEDEGEKYTVNIPVPKYSGNRTYKRVMDEMVVPILRQFEPELIVVGLGVDAHYCDTNSHLGLNTETYVNLCKRLISESKDGKIAFILEGGYHLRSTAEVAAGVLAAFEGRNIHPEYNEERQDNIGRGEIKKIKDHIGKYWDLSIYDQWG